jgi:hypothetical protein
MIGLKLGSSLVSNFDVGALERFLYRFFLVIPVVCLALSAISWLKYGVDAPFWDDWRKYEQGSAGSFDIWYLFQPENDTLYPIGKLLDSVAFHLLDGNSIPYQFISMVVVLGGLLFLQWRLLSRVAATPMYAACAFVFTIFMLQPDSYWGGVDLAYHQAVPLLCVLAILNLLFVDGWRIHWRLLFVLVLGLASGFVYISGAFAIFVLGVIFLCAQPFVAGWARSRILYFGVALVFAGGLAVAAQLFSITYLEEQAGRSVHMAYPWMGDFWLFMLGKVARSMLLPKDYPAFSLLVSLFFVISLASICINLFIKLFLRRLVGYDALAAMVVLGLCGVVFAYLGIVSAGRARFMGGAVDILQAFTGGYFRFHYFWVTLLLPWFVLMVLNALSCLRLVRNGLVVALPCTCVSICLVLFSGITAYDAYYKKAVSYRLKGLDCIRDSMQQEDAGFNCRMIYGTAISDVAKALETARSSGASFMRGLDYIPLPLGVVGAGLLFKLSEQDSDQKWVGAVPSILRGRGEVEAEDDAQLLIAAGDDMARCRVLEVNTRISVSQATFAQLFYQPIGVPGYRQENSQIVKLAKSDELKFVSFQAYSGTGFMDELRFDPVQSSQRFRIEDLEVRCRSRIAPQT